MQPHSAETSRQGHVLRRAWAAGTLHHAHLLTGDLVTSHALVLALAAAFNCEHGAATGAQIDPVACGTCGSCERIALGLHPDILTLAGEGAAGLIPIETVRDATARVALPPHEARVRIFIVADAAGLHGASANALLKTLEEPPVGTIFMICARSQDSVMATIRSRCQRHVIPAPAAGPEAETREADATLGHLVAQVLQAGTVTSVTELVTQHAGERGAERAAAMDLTNALLRLAATRARAALATAPRLANAWARCGTHVLAAQRAIALHNAAPTLTLESLLLQMHATGATYDRIQAS